MSKVLFVTRQDIVTRTPIGGSVDPDKFTSFMYMAQEIQLQSVIGTRLYEKLQSDILGNSLSGDYQTLVNDYIKDFVCFHGAADFVEFSPFEIKNAGIFKHESENSSAATVEELRSLSSNLRNKAEHYGRRLYDHLSAFNSRYPEWNQYQTGDMPKQGDTTKSSWVL